MPAVIREFGAPLFHEWQPGPRGVELRDSLEISAGIERTDLAGVHADLAVLLKASCRVKQPALGVVGALSDRSGLRRGLGALRKLVTICVGLNHAAVVDFCRKCINL